MKSLNKKLLVNLLVSLVLFLPMISFAKTFSDNYFPIIQCGSPNPCTFTDAVNTVSRIINWFISIAASLGAATLAYAGIQILMNPGNSSKISEARGMIIKTLIGLFWLLAAWVVIYALVGVFVGKNDPNGALRFLKQQ